jgi:hypothetical protein
VIDGAYQDYPGLALCGRGQRQVKSQKSKGKSQKFKNTYGGRLWDL